MMAWTMPIQFEHPWLLAVMVLAVPMVYLGRRSMGGLGKWRQRLAILIRVLVLAVLAMLLAGPMRVRVYRHLTVSAVVDRSRSVPPALQEGAIEYLKTATSEKPAEDRLRSGGRTSTPRWGTSARWSGKTTCLQSVR